MSISSCYNDIRMYNATKANMVSVANSLKSAINQFSSMPNTIGSAYSVDDNSTPIVGKCNELRNDMIGTFNTINGTILPAIDNAIARKRNQISRLEAEERAKQAKRNSRR